MTVIKIQVKKKTQSKVDCLINHAENVNQIRLKSTIDTGKEVMRHFIHNPTTFYDPKTYKILNKRTIECESDTGVCVYEDKVGNDYMEQFKFTVNPSVLKVVCKVKSKEK